VGLQEHVFVKEEAESCTKSKNKILYSVYLSRYEGQSVSFRIEFFTFIWSVVTTPAARGIIPKVSWDSVLKVSFLCASCVTQL